MTKLTCMQGGHETSTIMGGGLCPSCYAQNMVREQMPTFAPTLGAMSVFKEAAALEGARRFQIDSLPQTKPEKVEIVSPGQLMSDVEMRDYMRAYHSAFSETPALRDLWLRASEDGRSYESARGHFWSLVNQEESADAEFVRRMLRAANFVLGTGDQAPRLDMDWETHSETLKSSDLTASIDHAAPQSKRPDLATDPSNLRFMTQRLNSERGARYDEHDRRYPVKSRDDETLEGQHVRRILHSVSIREAAAVRRELSEAGKCYCMQCRIAEANRGALCVSCHEGNRAPER